MFLIRAIEQWYTFTNWVGGRRQDADKQSKHSAGEKEPSLYGTIARTATSLASSIEGAPANVR